MLTAAGHTCAMCGWWVPQGQGHYCRGAWPAPAAPKFEWVNPYQPTLERIALALERIAAALEHRANCGVKPGAGSQKQQGQRANSSDKARPAPSLKPKDKVSQGLRWRLRRREN